MGTRRLLGYALCCLGIATTAFAGGRYAAGEWQRQQARRSWDESQARIVVALARRFALLDDRTRMPATPAPPAPLAPGAPVARLLIPRLRLDEIVLEGVDDNTLNAGPGHLTGSAFPGERGNSVISAHRDRHFARLGELLVGDTVITEAGVVTERWVVISRRVIAADAPALFRSSDATLTLTTCWPIRYLGTAPERLLITAKPVASGETRSFAGAGAT